MRCPKCRSEVGSQKACPYCGTPLAAPEPSRSFASELANALNRNNRTVKSLENRIRTLEDKVNILLVLHGGTLAVLVLILIALQFK